MNSVPTEIVNLDTVTLNNETAKGLVPAQVAMVKESVIEINEELTTAGQCIRAVAAHLYEIKQNIKAGNWRAFLKSGVINCSERYAIDLVNAHEKWLGSSDVDDHILAPLSARSLNALGGKGVTENKRKKVFEAIEKGQKLSEASIRAILRGSTPNKDSLKIIKTADDRVADLLKKLAASQEEVKKLKEENKTLRAIVGKG